MMRIERLKELKNFMVARYLWIILTLFILLFIWLNPILFLDYIRVIIWPLTILTIIVFLKKEISLANERLKSFWIKGFGMELQGNLSEQNKDEKSIKEPENLPNSMIQEKLDEQPQTKEVVENLRRNLAIKEIEVDFERIYNRIFGSQFSLLERLVVSGGVLMSDQVFNFYKDVQNQYPILKSWEFTQYMSFLQNCGLIEYNNENNVFKISEKGKTFLKYIRLDMMYAGYKPL